MKFLSLQQDILPVLQSVSRSVGSHVTLPVLNNIFLATEGSKLKLAATNLEIGVIRYLPVEVVEDGEVTIPAKTLVEIISGLGQAKIEFESKGDVLTISSGKFKATVNGISSAEFPAIPLSDGKGIDFKKDMLVLSSQILFAAAVDEGRPILTGILTQASDHKLDLVATDGFRLAHRQIKLDGSKSEFKNLIPKRTFEEVVRIILEEEADEVNISTSENQNQVVFKIGQSIVSSRLIEGKFPTWESIIPAKFVSRAIVDKEDIVKAIKLAAVFAKSESNVLTIKTLKDKLSIASEAKELGSQENEVEGTIEGEELQIAFNAKFLLDAVSSSPSSQLMLEFSGPLSPALIKPVGVEGLEYIVMPVRLN